MILARRLQKIGGAKLQPGRNRARKGGPTGLICEVGHIKPLPFHIVPHP